MLVTAWCPFPLVILFFVSLFSYRNLRQLSSTTNERKSVRRSNSRNQQVAKSFALIIFAFFILTIPYAVFFLVWAYASQYDGTYFSKNMENFLAINLLLFFISSLTSIINPLIYARTSIVKYFKQWRNKTVGATTDITQTQTTLTSRKLSKWTIPPTNEEKV